VTAIALVTDAWGKRHRFTVSNFSTPDAAREQLQLHCRSVERFVPQSILICIPGGNTQ
jgi:hypothetical protein